MAKAKFSLLDLTVAQVEAIETRSGTAFDRWNHPKSSKAAVFGSILVELGGFSEADVAAMKFGDMVERVTETLDLASLAKDADPNP